MPDNEDQKLDAETQQILRNGQMIVDGVTSPFWNFIKSYMLARIGELDSVFAALPDMENKTDEEIARNMKARASAVAIMKDMIREVEATAEQHKINAESLNSDEGYILKT